MYTCEWAVRQCGMWYICDGYDMIWYDVMWCDMIRYDACTSTYLDSPGYTCIYHPSSQAQNHLLCKRLIFYTYSISLVPAKVQTVFSEKEIMHQTINRPPRLSIHIYILGTSAYQCFSSTTGKKKKKKKSVCIELTLTLTTPPQIYLAFYLLRERPWPLLLLLLLLLPEYYAPGPYGALCEREW